MNSLGENIEIHHNEGRIYRIKPRFNKDVNKWWISDEARYGYDFVHAEDRLRVPEQGDLDGWAARLSATSPILDPR